ncbi:ferredoxin [Frankia sp. AgB32]|uniref:ferredoxin n=1 Tax=Frankia sp. AgB32 TaxID=631119 RepID=UPI00201049CA|nr:ferredoxin [Frankia sp. AgB32]MCK9894525.1 ferredoxin [Frankia sp. AgB32]
MSVDQGVAVVDRSRCVGSGMCIVYAPGTFAHDDEAKAVVLDPAGDDLETVEIAVEACPTSALRLVGDQEEQ